MSNQKLYVMKALKIIGIVVLVIGLAVIVFILSLKGESHMERSVSINATPEKVFEIVNDFSYNKDWSPWFKIDENTNYVFSANTIGVGANYSWDSENPDVLSGKQEIIESRPNEYVNTKMVFGEMEGDYKAAFILRPIENGTEITWTLENKASNAGAGEKFFVDYLSEKILAPTYEEGLQSLKEFIENMPEPGIVESDSSMIVVEVMD